MSPRLLIADDEEVIASVLKTVFQAQGYEVATASSAAAATALLAREPGFDAVVTDMRMETESAGYEVVRAAAAHPAKPVIIILTAFPLLAQHWRQAGAHAVLTKPAQMSELLAVVAKLLQRRSGRRVLTRSSQGQNRNPK